MIRIQRDRIDGEAIVDSVRRTDAGAIVLFLGTVRADPGVEALDYEVYRAMATKQLRELARRARTKFGVLDMSIAHRLGRVPVGEDSVAIATAAAHRREAFEATAWAMDEIKRVIPIWKADAASRRPPARSRRRPGNRNNSAGPTGPAPRPREG